MQEFNAKPKEGKRKHFGRKGSQLRRTVAKDIEIDNRQDFANAAGVGDGSDANSDDEKKDADNKGN